jgi:exonuclease 3'-5' domain-containing protein 1
MSTTSAQSDLIFIDLEADLLPLLDSITNLAFNPPSLYIDLEGVDLGRHGSISILSLHIAPTQKTYLIDIHSLGSAAFSTTNSSGASLKTILESSTIPKVVFDVRNDSDALFSLFQISVDGIKDLQLMELAYRTGSRKFVSDLAKCIEKESSISAVAKTEWCLTKERGRRLFAPEKGGRYEVFNERPLNPEITQYCKQDVVLLPGLY